MVSRRIWFIVCAALLVFLPYSTAAQTPPHDSSNAISCRDCHDYLIQNGIFVIKVPRGEEQETKCKELPQCRWPGRNHEQCCQSPG